MSLRGAEKDVLKAFQYSQPGYYCEMVDGRLWVFELGDEGLQEFLSHGEPGKSVTLIGEGPYGMSLRGSDKNVLRNYMYSQPGYFTQLAPIGDRTLLWVFREGSEGHQEFLSHGEPAKSVTLIGEGPNGITLRGSDKNVLRAYAAMK